MISHAQKVERTQKSTLVTVWLDIANAYGPIPHKLIVFDLFRYDIAPQWIRLVENYYKGIFSKWFSESATSAWHRHQLGIFAGCTLSIIPTFYIILEYSLQFKVPKFTTNNTELPLLCAFMDDLNLMASTVSGAQTLLSLCTNALTWAGLEFRADKSCYIVIIKGRFINTTHFSVSEGTGQPEPTSFISSIHSRPVKFCGFIIDSSLSDKNSSVKLADKLIAGLRTIDKSHFTETQNVWILKHLLIPRIQCSLSSFTRYQSL